MFWSLDSGLSVLTKARRTASGVNLFQDRKPSTPATEKSRCRLILWRDARFGMTPLDADDEVAKTGPRGRRPFLAIDKCPFAPQHLLQRQK